MNKKLINKFKISQIKLTNFKASYYRSRTDLRSKINDVNSLKTNICIKVYRQQSMFIFTKKKIPT